MVNERLIMPEDFQFRKTENKRTRVGTTVTLDYKVKHHEIIFNYICCAPSPSAVREKEA